MPKILGAYNYGHVKYMPNILGTLCPYVKYMPNILGAYNYVHVKYMPNILGA